MKILFLDIDGVLNTESGKFYRKLNPISRLTDWFLKKFLRWGMPLVRWYHKKALLDPLAMSYIKKLLDEIPDLYIVISSTWRIYGLKQIKWFFAHYNIGPHRIIGLTPRLSNSIRGKEIQRWLSGWEMNPLVSCFMPKTARELMSINVRRKEYPEELFEEVELDYAILDDDTDILTDQLPYFIHVDSHDGLDHLHYEMILDVFGIRE